MELRASLDELERLWLIADPTSARTLRGPLGEEVIVQELTDAGLDPIMELRLLWSWHDGQEFGRGRESFAQRFTFLPLAWAVKKYKFNREMADLIRADAPKDPYPASWMPIIADHDKFQVLLDTASGQVLSFGAVEGAEYPLPSLAHLIDLWCEALRVDGWEYPPPDSYSVYSPRLETMELVARPGSHEWTYIS